MAQGEKKRKYDRKIERKLLQPRFQKQILEQTRVEWDALERDKRRKALLDMTKAGTTAVTKTALALLALAGIATIAIVAPNVISLLGTRGTHRRFFDQKQFRREAGILRRRGYIEYVGGREGGLPRGIKITKAGKKRTLMRLLGELHIAPQDVWDKKWRLVIFDIPDDVKDARDALRHRLQAIGCYRLQESVFVSPFPCHKEVDFLTVLYGVSHHVYVAELTFLSDDRVLREHFPLL